MKNGTWNGFFGAALASFALGTGVAVISLGSAPAAPAHRAPAKASVASAKKAYGQLPLAFEANGGHTDKRVDFLARGRGYTLFLTPGGSALALGSGAHSAVVRAGLVGAARVRGQAEAQLPGKVNYYVGGRSHWRSGISTYGRVRYSGVYPGVDLLYYGHTGQVEYDFLVAPGADPRRIALQLGGVRSPSVNTRGDLVLPTRAGTVKQLKPVAYQRLADGSRRTVDARYVIRGNRVRLRVGHYDRTRLLTIDPILGYSTYVGGSAADDGRSLALDDKNDAFITGTTSSSNYPLTANAYRSTIGGSDAFVTKLDPSGSSVLYSTYFGGNGTDVANAIALDSSGNVYIGGYTSSSDLPNYWRCTMLFGGTCPGLQGSQDGFAAKLNADGTFGLNFYVGGTGSDAVTGIDVDGNGDIDVVGQTSSTDFPVTSSTTTTPAAVQSTSGGGQDGFVSRIHYFPCQTTRCIVGSVGYDYGYSSYLGGTGTDDARGMALAGNLIWLVGSTTGTVPAPNGSGGLTTTGSAGGTDGYVAEVDTSQSGAASLLLAKNVGGSGTDNANAVSVTSDGGLLIIGSTPNYTAHIVGDTTSTSLPNYVYQNSAWSYAPVTRVGSDQDGFATDVDNADLSHTPTYAAFLGGSGNDAAHAVTAVSRTFFTFCTGGFRHPCTVTQTSEYIAGDEQSTNFPGATQLGNSSTITINNSDRQAFIWKRVLGSTSAAVWVGVAGGPAASGDLAESVAVDSQGRAYIAGKAGFQFPTTSGAYQVNGAGQTDAFVARVDVAPPTITSGPTGAWQKDGDVIGTTDVTFNFNLNEAGGNFYCSGVTNGVLDYSKAQPCDPPFSYSGLADGPQTFSVSTYDAGGSLSSTARRSFVVDTQPPAAFDLIAPDDGATTGTQPTFSWHAAVDAATKVSYQVMIDGQPVASVPVDSCAADGTCSVQPDKPIPTGTHNWLVRASDQVGHSTDSATRAMVVQEPPTARFSIAPNPALAGRTVTFDGSASQDAGHTIAKYEWDLDGDGSFEGDAGSKPTATKAYSKAQTLKISLRVTDSTGLQATSTQTLTVNGLGGAAGLLGVTINNGAQYTRTPDVTVSAVFPQGTTQMLISNDGGFLGPQSFPPQKETPWKLDSSGPERLPKTIYVRFFIGPIASETFQDDIILDEIPPVVQSAALAPTAGSASLASAARVKTWKLKVKAKDSNSGVKGVQVTANKKKPGKLLRYKSKLKVKSAVRPTWIRARDKAGNNSRWHKVK